MSQDLFAEDDDDNDPLYMVESSGVSASASSSSPASQEPRSSRSVYTAHAAVPPVSPQLQRPKRQVPVPAPAPPPAPSPGSSKAGSDNVLFTCPECGKMLKTKSGYNGHMKRYHSGKIASVQSAPISTAPPGPAGPAPAALATQPAPSQFVCPDCKNVLKSIGTFTKHRAAHKLKELTKKIPSAAQFKEEALEAIFEKIVTEILNEPYYGNDPPPKMAFLEGYKNLKSTQNKINFECELSNVICGFVCVKQTKLLPANQYEEAQKQLNLYLNQNDVNLRQNLQSVCSYPLEDAVAGRLVFRIATKLLKEVQCWVWENMRTRRQEAVAECGIVFRSMTEEEKKTFLISLGGFVRGVYQGGLASSSTERRKQSDCIRETFVDGPHPIQKRLFLNTAVWFSGSEQSIVPSEHASSFFQIIENEVLPTVHSFSIQEVVEEILDRPDMLTHWYHLTNAYFSESSSLLFMREFVASYLKHSASCEQRRQNRAQEKETQATAVALRTHLKKNYVPRKGQDDCAEDVE